MKVIKPGVIEVCGAFFTEEELKKMIESERENKIIKKIDQDDNRWEYKGQTTNEHILRLKINEMIERVNELL